MCMYTWLLVWNIFFIFLIYWEQSSQLTNIFQRGSNHQPDTHIISYSHIYIYIITYTYILYNISLYIYIYILYNIYIYTVYMIIEFMVSKMYIDSINTCYFWVYLGRDYKDDCIMVLGWLVQSESPGLLPRERWTIESSATDHHHKQTNRTIAFL
jgi:hypothetical protein